MESLLPVINKLQDVFHNVGHSNRVDLPQIVVIGSQSSGKSSVLENVVGTDFLPRGNGIVTRRPLILQLFQIPYKKAPLPKKTNNSKSSPVPSQGPIQWGEFLHIKNKKFYDFNEIRDEIVKETDRLTGKNKGISHVSINLKIYSPNVCNLTLVDLPGITKIPVGDQPKDIENQIKAMCLQFIKKSNSIILAVTAANTDIANSDGIKLAREVDPKGERTIGVLTKVDIMDKGTHAMDIIQGKVIKLRKGFIPVVNRSQHDIMTNKTIQNAIKDEKEFFDSHPAYKPISDRCGTKYLSKRLNNILLSHIKKTLPELFAKIQSLVLQAKKRMDEYGTPITETSMSKGAQFLHLLTKFSKEYVDSIDGRNVTQMTLNQSELFGGARINHIFQKWFSPYLNKIDACENLTEYDIRTAIRNAKGPKTTLFIPEESFEMLVKRQVKILETPCIRCVDKVYDELKLIVAFCEKKLYRFPQLRKKVKDFVVNLLKDYSKPLKIFITNLISIEMSYINTNHPDFFSGGNTAMLLSEKLKLKNHQKQYQNQNHNQNSHHNQQNQSPYQSNYQPNVTNIQATSQFIDSSPQDKEKMETQLIRALLKEYFNIIRKNITDAVPKAIMFFMVNKSKQNLQSELVRQLYKDEFFENLLKEDEEIASKRIATQKMLKVLLRAQDIMNEVNEYKF